MNYSGWLFEMQSSRRLILHPILHTTNFHKFLIHGFKQIRVVSFMYLLLKKSALEEFVPFKSVAPGSTAYHQCGVRKKYKNILVFDSRKFSIETQLIW